MTKILSFAFSIVIFISAQAFAQLEPKNFNFVADLTWASKYMIDGFNVGGDNPVLQFAAKTSHTPTGLSLMFWTAVQADRKNKQYDEQDFFVLYSRDFNEDSPYMLNLHGFYNYWRFPNSEPATDDFGVVTSNKIKHGNKFQAGISMPKLIPLFDSYVVPTYNAYQILHWEQDRKDLDRSGNFHELLLEYFKPVGVFIPHATYQYAGATASVNYNSGAFEVKPGLSHSTASLVAGAYALKSIFSVSLNHQWSYEKTLNPDNEFWTTFSYIKKF